MNEMPEYLAPGVYIEEVPAPQSIQGVSTSTAGFVGVTQKGPTTGLPQLVTSFKDFVTKFGGYLPEDPWGDRRYLAYAVEACFNNGAQRAYIKRVVSSDAKVSLLMLKDGFVTRLARDTAVKDEERTTAQLVSTRGIDVGSKLIFSQLINGVEQVTPPIEVVSYRSDNTLILASALPFRYTAAGASVFIDPATTPAGVKPENGSDSLLVSARDSGKAGDQILVSVEDLVPFVGVTDVLPSADNRTTTLTSPTLAFDGGNGPDVGATSAKLDAASYALVQVGDEIELLDGTAAPNTKKEKITITELDDATTTIKWVTPLKNSFTAGSSARRVAPLRPGKGAETVFVENVDGLAANDLVRVSSGAVTQVVNIQAVDNGAKKLTLDLAAYPVTQAFAEGAVLTKEGSQPAAKTLLMRSVNNFYKGAVIEVDDGATKTYRKVTAVDPLQRTLNVDSDIAEVVPAGTAVRVLEFTLIVDDGNVSERFERLSLDPAADNFADNVVNETSQLVQVTGQVSPRELPFTLPQTRLGYPEALQGGADGGVPSLDDFIGVDNGPGKRTGLKALEDIDDISIIAVPGISDPSVQGAMIIQCETLKDRFAVLDPAPGSPLDATPQGIIGQRSNHNSNYAAIYYPWLRIRDPLYPTARGGKLVPPSGNVIGIYARVDNEIGVHKAPANEVVRGVLDVEFKVNEREQAILNPKNINVIRDFRSDLRGIRVYGARCITSDNANKYIPVRRTLIFLSESMQEGLQFVVFRPNAEPLWQDVKRTLRGFLRTVWRSGALEGLTEDEAFRVYCNINQTMTEDDVANGRLIVEVWVALVRPAEFAIVQLKRLTREAQQG
jgi:uncharacterized protein